MKRAGFFALLLSLLLAPALRAQDTYTPESAQPVAAPTVLGRTIVVIPFENASPSPGLEWISESFPEAFHDQLNSPVLYVASRNERLRAYDRQGMPAGVHASRATIYRLTEEMDVDCAVLGSYRYSGDGDGARLTATAQLLDMQAQKLLPAVTESAPLADLGALQSALAWDLLRLVRTDFSEPKDTYIASVAPAPLDAQENFIRGLLATTAQERLRRFREATRLSPEYDQAWLELGKTYDAQHAYGPAIAALSQVRRSASVAREANFYLGLAAYDQGDLAKSEGAFEFVAAQLPLAEVYNNLGVVAASRGKTKISADDFERAIQNDPSDPDYHFNLALALAQSGDRAAAARELHTTLDHRPSDAEAKTVLDSLPPSVGSSIVAASSTTSKSPLARIKRNYEEDAFRQMTVQIGSWAEERFVHSDVRSDPHAHARFHIELGKELLAHGFTTEAESEFRHAAAVDPTSAAPLTALAEDYDARGDAADARAQAEAALRIRESADAYLILARLDLKENKMNAAAQNIDRALQLEPGNAAGQDLKRTLAAKLAEKAQPQQ